MTMLPIRPIPGRAWRAARDYAIGSWHDNPAALMVAYVLLAVAAEALARSANLELKPGGYGPILLMAFACWRVTRGGWFSRGFLIYVTVESLLQTVSHLAQWWDIQAPVLLAISLAGLALLLSPAVYVRTHPDAMPGSSSLRLRPGPLMLLSAPFAGISVAGLLLAVTRRWPLPGNGCLTGPVEMLPRRCAGWGRGFPVPVVTNDHGHHAVSVLAFARDCTQWTVAVFVASYLLWLAFQRRRRIAPGHPADPGLAVQPSR